MLGFLLLLPSLVLPGDAASPAVPWSLRDQGWRTDAAWYDGRAEMCVYEATRTIYGEERRYLARAYTNKQLMDPRTTTKATGDGLEVFKHHWSERVPTEAYDYDFSTATFTRADDLGAFKLTAATQEDCGASFKQVWREDAGFAWLESVYFPGGGVARGRLTEAGLHFEDELTLLLRDFPFEDAAVQRLELRLVPSQKDTHQVPFAPRTFRVERAGRELLALPELAEAGVSTYRLDLSDEAGDRRARYWFAADGAAPWLHALVRYEGPGGVTYRLRSLERTAYWER